MEVFTVNSCEDDGIDLVSEAQLESLLGCIKDSQEVMIKWVDEEEGTKNSKILITDTLMARLKDGRFKLTATEEDED
jgi:hypothetical protein